MRAHTLAGRGRGVTRCNCLGQNTVWRDPGEPDALQEEEEEEEVERRRGIKRRQ